jgi:hypothetical protein
VDPDLNFFSTKFAPATWAPTDRPLVSLTVQKGLDNACGLDDERPAPNESSPVLEIQVEIRAGHVPPKPEELLAALKVEAEIE